MSHVATLLIRAFYASVEWRFIAFLVTTGYFYFVLDRPTHEAAVFSLGLQAILLVLHTLWLARRRP